LDSFIYAIGCICGYGGPPNCSARNFAPEIWDQNPATNPTINSNSSQNFQISVADPNNNAFSIYWYNDGKLIATNVTSWTFVANASLIGSHLIEAIALDWLGQNVSINNGPHNSQRWNLVVT
jgi:hypothetical protein